MSLPRSDLRIFVWHLMAFSKSPAPSALLEIGAAWATEKPILPALMFVDINHLHLNEGFSAPDFSYFISINFFVATNPSASKR